MLVLLYLYGYLPLFTVGQVPHPLLILLLQEVAHSKIKPRKRNKHIGFLKNPRVVFNVSLLAVAAFIGWENGVQFKISVFIVLIFSGY